MASLPGRLLKRRAATWGGGLELKHPECAERLAAATGMPRGQWDDSASEAEEEEQEGHLEQIR